jgi:uncharacterized protein with PQ loop repeat
MAEHHLSQRKRIHQKHEHYPHPDPVKRFLDCGVYVVGLLGPVFALSQVYKIFSTQSAAGLSLLMFAFNAFGNIWWIVYGGVHKERVLQVVYASWFVINVAILVGVIMYS